jgi:hypothetical protein
MLGRKGALPRGFKKERDHQRATPIRGVDRRGWLIGLMCFTETDLGNEKAAGNSRVKLGLVMLCKCSVPAAVDCEVKMVP